MNVTEFQSPQIDIFLKPFCRRLSDFGRPCSGARDKTKDVLRILPQGRDE